MQKKIFYLFTYLVCFSVLDAINIIQEPIATAYTPNSILVNPPPEEIRYAGTRIRYSTCTGTAWLQGDKFLAAINFLTSSIQIYEFDANTRTLTTKRAFSNADGLELARPENLSFSKDFTLLAIPNMKSGDVNIYEINGNTFLEDPLSPPFFIIHDKKVHGARFSPSGKHLAYVTLDDLGEIVIYKISNNENEKPLFKELQRMPNAFYPLKPKSIDFSHDGRFVVIGYSEQLSGEVGLARAVLASYAFNSKKGISPKPLSVIKDLLSAETIQFYLDSSCVFAVDQVADRLTGHSFDLNTGKLKGTWVALHNPEAELSLPHGMNFSSDGKYLSVSNYGEDKVTVYSVEQSKGAGF